MTVMLLGDNEVGLKSCRLAYDCFINGIVELDADRDFNALALQLTCDRLEGFLAGFTRAALGICQPGIHIAQVTFREDWELDRLKKCQLRPKGLGELRC